MIYAVGDIHGQLDMLEDALNWIEADGGPDAEIIFMGDYTDRGPHSRQTLDLLIEGQAAGRNWTFLKGNHDRMFLWFLESPSRHDPQLFMEYTWHHERLGGTTTLQSYGLDFSGRRRFRDVHEEAREMVPQSHIDFLQNAELTVERQDMFFVHAGVRPGIPFRDQTENDLLWIREEFVPHTDPFEKLIVHGHTALDTPTHYGNRINTDGGAGYGRPIWPVILENGDVWVLNETGRQDIQRG